MPTSTVTDEILFEALNNGDEKAFEQLYYRYWEKLTIAAYHRVGDLDIAKEIVQDIFTNLWQKKNKAKLETSFAPYVFTAMRNRVLNYIRSLKTKEKYVNAIKHSLTKGDLQETDVLAYNEFANLLEYEVNKLPERCRQVFHLSRFEFNSTKEIAEQLKISPKTVENQLTKALKVLRTSLSEYAPYLLFLLSHPMILY